MESISATDNWSSVFFFWIGFFCCNS
jgi:hypothetical protein